MADQSAIRIPQGQLPINLVDDVMSLYCSPGGSDSSGDGSLSNPYFHPNRALADLKRLFFTETGSAVITCLPGTFNYDYPIVVKNQTKKKISIKGSVGRSFKLQEVTSYNYDAHENITDNGHGVGSLVDNRITVKLATTNDLLPPPASEVLPSVDNISVGDYILFRDETIRSQNYYPTGKDNAIGGEGLTGPNPGDARTNVLGCYEIIAVNDTDSTVTFRSRGKNFLHKVGRSKINKGSEISLDDDIYVGGYRSINGCETGDPTGKYGTLQTTGIDTATGTVVSDHAISARIMKSILKWQRPDTSGRKHATKGLVIKPNSSLHGLSDLVFQGDVRFKHFNEMDPAASNGEAILAFKNSSIGNGLSENIGISGWYAGVVAHTNSRVSLDGLGISDCSFGMVAENNSTITSKASVLSGCDVIGIVANNNSIVRTQNTTVGSAGYSPLTIDLDDIGSGAAELESGDTLSIFSGDEGGAVTTRCVWNSYRDPYNKMTNPEFDLYNYYPLNTGNQIYLRPTFPTPGGGFRDESINETPPNWCITINGFSYGVGMGVLPETATTSTYEANEACGDENQDLNGGVCKPPGFFGDPFDFVDLGGFLNDEDDGTELSCMVCTNCQACLDGCADGDLTGDCFDACCDKARQGRGDGAACDEMCDRNGFDCDGNGNTCPTIEPPDNPGDECTGEDICTNPQCHPTEDDEENYCAFCELCPGEAPESCFCFCNRDSPCCGPNPPCDCEENNDACCDVNCTQEEMCHGSGCCCDQTDADGLPCYCRNTSNSCSGSGTPCPGFPGLPLECMGCVDDNGNPQCLCPPDSTANPLGCPTEANPCNTVEPPDETTYRLIDHPMGIGILAHNNSSIDAPRCFVSLLRNGGFVAMENSSIDANLSFVRGCAGPGYLSRENSSINARNSSAQRTRGGYTARQNSNIQAQAAHATDNAEYNFIARNDSIINCEKATSAISRTMDPGTTTVLTITTANQIYAGLSTAHGQSNLGSFINKTGIIESEDGEVTPDGADKWAVDSSSHIEPTTAN